MDDKNSKDSTESNMPQRGSSGPSSTFPTWAKMLLSALTAALVASAVIAGHGGRRADPRMARGDFDDMEKPRRITSPARPPVTKQPLPSKDYILDRLKDIAQAVMQNRSHYFITPAELYDVMSTAARIPFSSLLHMVQVLKSLGLQSQIRSVPGREERRWYDLSRFAGDRNVG